MPRAQNAHAYVNAAFLIKFNENMDQVLSATACFGGINPQVTSLEILVEIKSVKCLFLVYTCIKT